MGIYCTHRVLCFLSVFGLPEIDLLKSSGQSVFSKNVLDISPLMSSALLFKLDLRSRISEFRPVVFGLIFYKRQVTSAVTRSQLSLDNLIPLTTFYSAVFLSFDKIIPLRIDENRTTPDWHNSEPSGLTKIGPLRIGKIGTPPDWDPSCFVKHLEPSGLGPLRVCKNLDPSGLGPLRVCKDSFSEAF